MNSKADRQSERRTETVTIRMERDLHRRIADLAMRERRSRTAQIELLLERALDGGCAQ